ncbi:hypothetical protein [Streptomyces sp. cmx-18-6]|uniref:hypothetical protein n=1 Tax=Streptomyces sp. cmx-18-6 TaxID=2790930 RepID=UPI00397EEA29
MIGSTAIAPVTPTHRGTTDSEQTAERLALLTARTGLEPELAQRYISNPLSVLAEFGLAAEPVYMEMNSGRPKGLSLEDLDGTASGADGFCNFTTAPDTPAASYCNFTTTPDAPAAAFTNFTTTPDVPAAAFCNFTTTPDAPAAAFTNFTTTPDVPTAAFCNFTTVPDAPAAAFTNFTTTPDAAAGRS